MALREGTTLLSKHSFRSLLRSRHARALALVACVLAAALGLPGAHAQAVGRLDPLDPSEVAIPFVVMEVSITPQQFAKHYDAYLDGFLKVVADLDAERARFRTRHAVKPGTQLTGAQMAEWTALHRRALDAHAALLAESCDRIKAAVPAEQVSTVDTVRAIVALRVLTDFARFLAGPQDLGMQVRVLTPDMRAQNELLRAALASHLPERTRAFKEFVSAGMEQLVAKAKLAEAAGVAGMTPQESQAELQALQARVAELMKNSEANKAELEALKSRRQAAADMGVYRSRITPEWISVARAEMEALKDLEAKGQPKAWLASVIYDRWMPRLMSEFPRDAPVVDGRGSGGRTTPEIIRDLLRTPGLTKEQQEQVRTMGRALVAAQRARWRKEVEEAIAANAAPRDQDDRGEWFLAELRKIGSAIGHPEIGVRAGNGWAVIATSGLGPALSDEDIKEFGEVYSIEDAPRATVRWYARSSLQPAPYPADFAKQVQELLRIPAEQAPIVAAVAADAELRWNERVKPLLPELNRRPDVRAGDNDEWRQECARLQAARAKAFHEAASCDNDMLDALAAGLGDKADLNALATLRASLRTAECVAGGGFGRAALLDAPRAVLEAKVSDATRRVMMAEFAALAPQWIERAKALLSARIAAHEIGMFSSGWSAAAEMQAPAIAAWAGSETEAIERVAAKLAPADADDWRAWTRSLQWPGFYIGVGGPRGMAERALRDVPESAAILTSLDQLTRVCDERVRSTGDAAVEMLLRAAPRAQYVQPFDPMRGAQGAVALAQERTEPFVMVNWARTEMANELVLHMLPPSAARTIQLTPIFPLREEAKP